MGIDVSASKVVTFNPAHEQRVNTDPQRTVSRINLDDIVVASIFRRRKFGHDTQDGNPLIYAIKGKFGFTIPRRDFQEIHTRALQILPLALAELGEFDIVIPLPSSSNVARLLARRIVRSRPGSVLLDCLDKATVAHVLASALPPTALSRGLARLYVTQLNTYQKLSPNSLVEMKKVNSRIRPFINPVVAGAGAGACGLLRVVLVDDIYGTGATLRGAVSALQPFGPASICALTYLSRL